VIYVALGFLIFAFLMGAGGALGGSLQESQQVGGIFGWFAAAPLWIIGFIFSNPNAAIARVLSWFPLTAPTMMILRLSFGNVALIDIIGSLVVTTLTVPFVIWAGAKVFRAGLLNYGKRPNLKQVWKIIRG
jgi:ABC-2 type transport system permease protein